MKNKINLTSKVLLALSLVGAGLYADTYKENYSVAKGASIKPNDNFFMNGDFQKIVRFDKIDFSKDTNSSKEVQNNLIKTVKSYLKDSKDIRVKLIGHTRVTTDDMNEKTIDSDTYANKIQNWFRDTLTTQQSEEKSSNYAQKVCDFMVDNNISRDIIVLENRAGNDLGFSDATDEGIELSNRVMAVIYVLNPKENDSDNDGIYDSKDRCPSTPAYQEVDTNGCSLDSDNDGVVDSKDRCPNTQKSIAVDSNGCPLDSDNDGVYDFEDRCADTPLNLDVDKYGCPLVQVLHINFETSSSKILEKSYGEIEKFAKFMKEHPMYKAELVGHTDSTGSAKSNMQLSQRRALSVKNALVAQGIDELRLKSSGRGELEPVATNETPEGKLANRRTEVKLSY